VKDIVTLPEYKIEIPNEKLIECMLEKKDTEDKEERRDQAAYMVLNKNLIDPLLEW
jgi:hypothetical protein